MQANQNFSFPLINVMLPEARISAKLGFVIPCAVESFVLGNHK
jgi:hypothetical protein